MRNLGSGFPLILSAWNEKHWLKPELIEQPELMQVKLILHIENIGDETKSGTKENYVLKNVLKNVPKDVLKKLTDRQLKILELINSNSTITGAEMASQLGVVEKTIQRDLAAIRQLGIDIIRKEGKTYGKWIIKTDE